jgi:hypothetical protein
MIFIDFKLNFVKLHSTNNEECRIDDRVGLFF